MPNFEKQEHVDKAINALKEYQAAKRAVNKAAVIATDKLGALKTITGITSNDAPKIEEEVILMLGRYVVDGLPEVR